jgi:hypothetical protein
MGWGKQISLAAIVAVTALIVGGCDLVPPARPRGVPAAATLHHDLKGGWIWSQCVDAPTGSVGFSWNHQRIAEPHIELRLVGCAAAGHIEAARSLEIRSSEDDVRFVFAVTEVVSVQPGEGLCPLKPDPEMLARFVTTLRAVESFETISDESRERVVSVRTLLEAFAQERLQRWSIQSDHQGARVICDVSQAAY